VYEIQIALKSEDAQSSHYAPNTHEYNKFIVDFDQSTWVYLKSHMKYLKRVLRVYTSILPIVFLMTLFSTTGYAFVPVVQNVSITFHSAEDRLGATTEIGVKIKEADESNAKSNSSPPGTSGSNTVIANTVAAYNPAPERTYYWCWKTRNFAIGFCKPSPTPTVLSTPTPTQAEKEAAQTVSDTSTTGAELADWCYDTDGDNSKTKGVCGDATGIYTDTCHENGVREYVCEGKWNGKEFTKQRCVAKTLSCSGDSFCQIGTCVEKSSYIQTVEEATSDTSAPTTANQNSASTNQPTKTETTPRETQVVQDNTHEVKPSYTPLPTSRPSEESANTPTTEVIVLPPTITFPTPGSTLDGKTSIAIDAKLFSSITILLQPVVSIDDRIYLGKVSASGNKNIEWDTTLVPNGEYYLFAVAHKAVEKFISTPIKVEVYNDKVVGEVKTQLILPSKFKPETVPVNDDLTFQDIATETNERGQAVVMQGKSIPYAIISILIYSNPIVVTVQADANGVWTYILEEPLEAGEHTAYIVVPQEDGTQVRSEPNTFIVPPVYASVEDDLDLQQGVVPESNIIRNFIVVTLLLIFDAIAILSLVYRMKNKKKKDIYVG